MQVTGLQNFLDTIQVGKEVFRNWEMLVMERKIYASYTENSIRVYQAYNNSIADECLKLGTFGMT